MGKVKGCWGVITRDKNKMETIFNEIENEYIDDIISKTASRIDRKIEFSEGYLRWYQPTPNSIRGIRFNKIWLDIELIHDTELMSIIHTSLLDYNKNISLI